MEYWSVGVLEYWSIGVLEYWSVGVLMSSFCTLPKKESGACTIKPNAKRQTANVER
jgi:hypothetical protein